MISPSCQTIQMHVDLGYFIRKPVSAKELEIITKHEQLKPELCIFRASRNGYFQKWELLHPNAHSYQPGGLGVAPPGLPAKRETQGEASPSFRGRVRGAPWNGSS